MGMLNTHRHLKLNVKIIFMKSLNICTSRCLDIYTMILNACSNSFFTLVCLDEILLYIRLVFV
jgi:hypothetical protein